MSRDQLGAPVHCTISIFHVRSLHGILAEICLDIYMRLGQIPLYRKMYVDLFPKISALKCQVLLHLIDLLFFH